jgi:hypothetical protein
MSPQDLMRRYGLLLVPAGLGALVVLGFLGWYVNYIWNSSLMGASSHYGAGQLEQARQPSGPDHNLGR